MPVVLTTLVTAITTGFTALTAGFTLGGAVSFALKTAALIGLQFLLRKRAPEQPIPDVTQSQTFSTGPARWVLGRARVGGVVAFAAVDEEVPRTELGGESGTASDLHMILALSEGNCDAIEAVYIGDDRFDVDFTSEGYYARRNYKDGDSAQIVDGLGVIFEQEKQAWYDRGADRWRETNPYEPDRNARLLDPENDDDAERIRIARMANAVTIWPYMNSDIPQAHRFRSVRYYTARDFNDDADPLWNTETAFGKPWTTSHDLTGLACVHIKLRQRAGREFDRRAFRNGFPQVSFLVRGIRVTIPNPADNGATMRTEWTDNAAALRYWWHRERLAIPSDAIDTASFVRAYNHCNSTITPTVPDIFPGYGENKPRWATQDSLLSFRKYSINGVLASGEKPSAVEAEFDDCWQGIAVESGGRFFYYPGGVETAEQEIVDGTDLLEFPTITPTPSLTERTNAVSITIEQSTFMDFKSQSIRDIVDTEKLELVDDDLYLPADLGTLRWVNNPAAAYFLGTVNLRRARASTTLSIKLPPGNIRRPIDEDTFTDNEPIKYLTMEIGRLYSVTIEEEGLEGRQMMLVEKSINKDMSVNATFVDSPADLYDGSYRLPALDPPPPYVPTRMGSRPPKPTGLVVSSKATVSDDGTFEFEVEVFADLTPLPVKFRLVAGDTTLDSPPVRDGRYTFKVVSQRQEFRIQARSIDTAGVESLPTIAFHTPSFAGIVLARPIWSKVIPLGSNLQMTFESVAYSTPISGVEIRYTRADLGATTDPVDLTPENWTSVGKPLDVRPIQIVRGLDITVATLLNESGIYKLFARYVSPISGVTGTRGPISTSYRIEYSKPATPINTSEEAPLWPGKYWNLEVYTAKAGVTQGYPLVMMAHQVPNYDEDNPSQANRDFLDDIPLAIWNGNTASSFPSLTSPWRPAWLFGECAGYDAALDESGRSDANERVLEGGDSTWYRTLPIDFGTTKAVEVFGQISSFTPGTGAVSNLTFGNAAVLHQIWLPNSAIPAITLPAARSGTGTVVYTIEGVPSGVTLDANRVLSGTVSVGSATGTATYIARDGGGGEARLSFTWAIIAGVTNPIRVNTPSVTNITRTGATISWAVIAGSSYYELSYTPAGGDESVQSNIFGTEYILGGLEAGTTYTVKVRSRNAGGPGNYSPTVDFTTSTATQAPSVPTGLTLTNDNGIRANWNADTNASSYEIRWKKTTEQAWPLGNIRRLITTNTYTIQPAVLEDSTAYHVAVLARNSEGASDWTASASITTSAAVPSAPTISSVTDGTSLTPSVLVAVSTVTGENRTDIEVKADRSDGVYSPTATIRTFTGSSPHEVFNVIQGYTYTFRARKRVAGNRFTAWSSAFTYVKGNVPGQVASFYTISTSAGNPPTGFVARRLVWSNVTGATKYRIRYWDQSTPTNVHEFAAVKDEGQSWMTRNFQRRAWILEISAGNADGYGLPTRIFMSLATLPPAVPAAPINLVATAVSATEVHLNWDNAVTSPLTEAWAVNYEVRATGFSTVAGITNTHYNPTGLTAGTDYAFQVRSKYQGSDSQYSEWVNFDAVKTDESTVATRYALPASTNLALTPKSTYWGGREIDYSFTTPVTGNVGYFQIRFREATDTENGTASGTDDRKLNRGVLATWHYFDIQNTFTSGTRTFTGEFDPMFSRCVYKVQIRAYLTADDSTLGGSKGFGAWKDTNNTQTIYPYRQASTSPYYSISNYTDPDTSRSVAISNLVYNQGTRLKGSPMSFVRGRWGRRQSGSSTVLYDVTINIDTMAESVEQPGQFGSGIGAGLFNGTLRDINTESWTGFSGEIGDTFNLRLTFYDAPVNAALGNWLLRPQGKITTTASYTIPTTVETQIPNVTGVDLVPGNEDVVVTANEVLEADGYEFTIREYSPNIRNNLTSHVYPQTSHRQYLKRGARNELFTVSVRAYYAVPGNSFTPSYRIWSPTPFVKTYTGGNADPASLHKITGLVATRDADSTDFAWNAISSSLFPNVGYQCQYSTNNGTTWLTNSTQYRTTNSFALTSTEAPLNADVMMRVRPLQGTTLSTPTNTGRSWTSIGFKAVASNEGSGGPGRIRQVVATGRNDSVHLDWSTATGSGTIEIESAAPAATPSWASIATDVSSNTTEWATSQSAYATLLFRLRQKTSETNGDWTYVLYTGEQQATVGDVPSTITSATYHTITLSWGAAPNARGYDVEYRKSGDSTWKSHLSNHTGNRSTIIQNLDDGSTYQMRVRGRDGDTLGDWFEDSENTLTCTGLAAPSFLFTITGETMRITWTAVTNANGYKIEVSQGNTVLATTSVTGTSKEYQASDFSSLTRPANVSVRMLSIISDCEGSYGSKQTKNWPAASTGFTLSTPGAGTSSVPHILTGGNSYGEGSVDIPFSAMSSASQDYWFRWTAPATLPSSGFYNFDVEPASGNASSLFHYAGFRTYPGNGGVSVTNNTTIGSVRRFSVAVSNLTASQQYIIYLQRWGDGRTSAANYPVTMTIDATAVTGAAGTAVNAVAQGATGTTVNLGPSDYEISEVEPVSELIRPFFSATPEYQMWQTGESVSYTLPEPIGGKAPYRIEVSNYPGGLTFDEATRTFEGTITNPGPETGYCTVQLIDANDNFDKAYLPWAIATTAQPGPSIGSGFGVLQHPYELICLTKGNMRAYLGSRANGGTNAADISSDAQNARNIVSFFQCPTRGKKFVRLRGAANPDFDLCVKIGTTWLFSDTSSPDEFIEYDDSDYVPGALIGIYKYSETTVTSGLSESDPQPIVLEWGPQIETPTETSGDFTGAASTAAGDSANEAQATQEPEGEDETDIYVLYRSGQTGSWSKQGPLPKTGNLWQALTATNVRQICFEAHFRKWKNRALQRLTTGWRDA